MEVWGVVVAGGSGRRFGSRKQLEELDGRRVVDRAIDALRRPGVVGIVVVVPPDLVATAGVTADAVVAGGESRSASVRNGLAALPAAADAVLVHDGARPLVPAEVVDAVIAALADGADAVVPVVPVTDTLRRVDGGTVDRATLVAVQTPQGFVVDRLREAHASGADATDDASLIDRLGGTVVHVDGASDNLKVTRPVDLVVARAILRERALGDQTVPPHGATQPPGATR